MRSYTELSKLETFSERFEYLKMSGEVGSATFGTERYLNQVFYQSPEWKRARREAIIRDNGCDLGDPRYEIKGKVIIHHMNPITADDIRNRNPDIFNPEYLICVSHKTHNDIHYDVQEQNKEVWTPRSQGDTCPWKR